MVAQRDGLLFLAALFSGSGVVRAGRGGLETAAPRVVGLVARPSRFNWGRWGTLAIYRQEAAADGGKSVQIGSGAQKLVARVPKTSHLSRSPWRLGTAHKRLDAGYSTDACYQSKSDRL